MTLTPWLFCPLSSSFVSPHVTKIVCLDYGNEAQLQLQLQHQRQQQRQQQQQ
jgi:hypothetical protein